MGLIGNFQALAVAGNPPSINYVMFVVAFAIVSLFYLFPASISLSLSIHPVIMVVLDSINVVFWLTAAIVLAARLQAGDCSDRVREIPLFVSSTSASMLTSEYRIIL